MENQVSSQGKEFLAGNRKKRTWKKIVGFLGCIVVFCTTYALILPAITLEADVYCQKEEHTHTEECYAEPQTETVQTLNCNLREEAAHSHEESCYIIVDGHTHTDACYTTTVLTDQLVCTDESQEHMHTDACYAQKRTLTCGLKESAEQKVLVCEKEVTKGHVHSDSCYKTEVITTDGELICGKEEHIHTEACYADPSADLETAEDWEKTIADVELTGDWAKDVLAVADSQLGYTESSVNYIIEDGEKKGYSRYGAWYGDAYGHWCAMYISFCLSYAEVADFPYESNCQEWIELLSSDAYEMYAAADTYTPKAGDIIFFNYDEEPEADHVGFVYELIEETDTEPAKIKTIEGNSDNKVQYVTYAMDDESILGYGILPEKEEGYSCGYVTHTHSDYCYGTDGRLLCQVTEHQHDSECPTALTDEEQAEVDYVISLIDSLPGIDEIEAALLAYEEAEDWTGYEIYYNEISYNGSAAYDAYMALNENQKALVTNIGKLMDLSNIWSAVTLIEEISSDKPTTVPSVSTSEFIELNLYDYGSNINEKYNTISKEYPGFQWNGGAYLKDNYDRHVVDYIDFGNSMITDFEYGSSSSGSNGKSSNAQMIGDKKLTNINKLDVSDYGVTNRPVGMSTGTEVLLRTLGTDGYPALTDGTSLSYLFDGGTYATKQNTESIDGLFQQDPTTGGYYYNSRWNHAQYSNNKFTLYNQIITPNFIVYPFGNFLPFNTITDNSDATQVSKITSVGNYVQNIINDLEQSIDYSSNTTKQQLREMLVKYQNDLQSVTASDGNNAWTTWDALEAIKDYFITNDKNSDHPSDDTSQITNDLLAKMYNIDWDVQTNFFFGMEMKTNFIQPKGGMTGNDTNGDGKSDYRMEFYFTGDDDVWVYVDDVLFLDLSGIHRHVGGKIDFANGIVEYYALDTKNTGDVNTEDPYKTYTFKELLEAAGKDTSGLNEKGTFKDYTTHKFNFYYMERGSGSSVCRMNFNFPLLKRNTISVSKELTVDEGDKAALLGNPDFKFQILKADNNGNKLDELFIDAGVEYTIYDENDNKIGNGITDSNGVFSLKAGQRAEFSGIKENLGKYYVRELFDSAVYFDENHKQYGSIIVNGSITTVNDKKVTVGSDKFIGVDSSVKDVSDGSTFFKFNNQVDFEKLGSLEISKVLDTYPQTRAIPEFEFEVTLDGKLLPVGTVYTVDGVSKTVQTEGIVVVPAGAKAKIENIIAGTKFVVKETMDSSFGYTVTYSGSDGVISNGEQASGTIVVDSTVGVTVTNSENGTTLQIPVKKTVPNSDGTERTFAFALVQVTDSKGDTLLDGGVSQTAEVTAKDTSVCAFTLQYLQKEILSYPAVYYYRVTEITGDEKLYYDESVYVVEVTVWEGLTAKVTGIYKDGTKVQETEIGAENEWALEFENILLGDLSLTKQVTGGSSDQKFTFTIKLEKGNSGLESLPETYDAVWNHGGGEPEETQVSFTNGVLTVEIGHGESLTIQGIPRGVGWKITENNAKGYNVSWTTDDGSIQNNVVTGDIINVENSVICLNAMAYKLPETGGTGTKVYIMAGVLLMSSSFCLLYKKRRNAGRRSNGLAPKA